MEVVWKEERWKMGELTVPMMPMVVLKRARLQKKMEEVGEDFWGLVAMAVTLIVTRT